MASEAWQGLTLRDNNTWRSDGTEEPYFSPALADRKRNRMMVVRWVQLGRQ